MWGRPWPFIATWRHQSRDHSIRNRPFPIGNPSEPSLYLYRFSRYSAQNLERSKTHANTRRSCSTEPVTGLMWTCRVHIHHGHCTGTINLVLRHGVVVVQITFNSVTGIARIYIRLFTCLQRNSVTSMTFKYVAVLDQFTQNYAYISGVAT